MWIYLRRASHQSGIIRASLWFSFVHRLGGYVLFSLFSGLSSFLFGTRGRDWSYLAPQRNWSVKSPGNPFSKYPHSPSLWSCCDLGSLCHTRRFKITSGSRFSSYRLVGFSLHWVLRNGILWSTFYHLWRYLRFYFFFSYRVSWVPCYYRDHSLDDTRYSLIYGPFQSFTSLWLRSSCLVPVFCGRGSVIFICLYLLVGRFMTRYGPCPSPTRLLSVVYLNHGVYFTTWLVDPKHRVYFPYYTLKKPSLLK